MAHLACPCGNSLSNSCDGEETEYYFVENGVIEAHQDDFAFFELEYNDLSTEIWKCDVCDRMMFFDGPSAPVSRYMRRIDAESLGKDELAREHKSGICFNNLLFNEVDWFVGSEHESNGEPDYEILGNPGEPDRGPLFTCRMMEEQIFSHENGRFRNWWYADLYDDLIVFYSPLKDGDSGDRNAAPVKAWGRYSQVWRSEE